MLNTNNLKVLIIGRGGREHAIAEAVVQSPLVKRAYVAPGNPGIGKIATNINISELAVEELVDFAINQKIDLTIVGPESSLELGIVDTFHEAGLKIFGPSKKACLIESSKAYAKEIMDKYDINTACYQKFTDIKLAKEYAKKISYPHVIKYDGLASGKGVVICESICELNEQIEIMLGQKKYGNNPIIIEEFLCGEEFTLLALVKNDRVFPLEVSRDFKRAYNNDKGPNTGGMGAICPFDKISQKQRDEAIEILEKTAKGLVLEKNNFVGVLYGGFIATEDGVKVIEYNARFGDPETEVVLQKLNSDLVELIIKIMNDKDVIIENNNNTYVGVCLAAEGYPKEFKTNFKIVLPNVDEKIYHMGTKDHNGKLLSAGGRVLMVTANGKNIKKAREKVYDLVESISCEDLFYRDDIGE